MNCIICGQNTCVNVKEGKYSIKKCLSCGIKFLDPLPTKEQLDNLYGKETYFKNSDGEVGYKDYLREEKIHRINFSDILKMMPVKDSLLDFGCAYGLLIDEAKKIGWKITDGVEPCGKARDYIRDKINKDAKIFADIGEINSGEKYDLCVMYGVLEHLINPREIMEKIYSITNDGGRVLVLTNNYDSLMPLRWRGIEHPLAFSRKSLTALMRGAGFEVEFCKINKKWYDTVELLERVSFYVGFSLKFLYFLGKIKKNIKIPTNEIICLAKK
jgi:SAM-dependent methyltransferase